MRRHGIPAVVVAVGLALWGCGGGGGDNSEFDANQQWLEFDSTTSKEVTSETVSLTGQLFKQGPYDCSTCPSSRPDTVVTWTNVATGQSGRGGATYIERVDWPIGCWCSSVWGATVALGYGSNDIRVRAQEPDGRWAESSITVRRSPVAPQGLVVEGGTGETVVSWEPVADATSYTVYWSPTPATWVSEMTPVAGVQPPYRHTGLTDDVAYYYRVAAMVGAVEGASSEMTWATPGWRHETVATLRPDVERLSGSIAVDPLGRPTIHAAWEIPLGESAVGTERACVVREPQGWVKRLTVAWGTTRWAQVEVLVDDAGGTHLFWHGFPSTLKHSFAEPGGPWVDETADSGFDSCEMAAVLDGKGALHLASRTDDGVRYATNAGGTWVSEPVGGTFPSGGCRGSGKIAVAVDPGGVAHVAFLELLPQSFGSALWYGTNAGGTWTVETVADANLVDSLSMGVGPDGTPHLAYLDTSGLWYARRVGTSWTVEPVAPYSGWAPPVLAADGSGASRILFWDGFSGGLALASNAGGSWAHHPVLAYDHHAWGPSTDYGMAVDAQGRVHVVFFDVEALTMNYLTNRWE